MTRNGQPIKEVRLEAGADAGISYSMGFAEWEAAVAAGLSLWDWESDLYPKRFKAKVIAWFSMHRLVEAHAEDAAMQKARSKSKMK